MTLGAYYPFDPNLPIDGLAGHDDPTSLGLAEETLIERLKARGAGSLGVFAPWAEQTSDVDWQPVSPDYNIAVYPLTDSIFAEVERSSFGHEIPAVAVIVPGLPVRRPAAEQAWEGTPFEMLSVEAVYALSDPAPVPKPWILYTAQRRTEPFDEGRGRGSLDNVAAHLGGKLVYTVQTKRTGNERPAPDLPVTAAFAPLLPDTGVPAPSGARPVPGSGGAVVPTTTASPTTSASVGAGGWPWWAWALVGSAGLYGGYRLYKRGSLD